MRFSKHEDQPLCINRLHTHTHTHTHGHTRTLPSTYVIIEFRRKAKFAQVCIVETYGQVYRSADKSVARPTSRCILFDGWNISFDASLVIYIYLFIYIYIRGVPGGMCQTSGGVPYVKVYRYNPKHLCPTLNCYGDNGQRSLKI